MKTILRHMSSGKYFQALNKWTSNPAKAHDFHGVGPAFWFAHKAGFPDMELVISLEPWESRARVPKRGTLKPDTLCPIRRPPGPTRPRFYLP